MNHQIKKLGVFRSISLWHARGTYWKSLSGSKRPNKIPVCVCVCQIPQDLPLLLRCQAHHYSVISRVFPMTIKWGEKSTICQHQPKVDNHSGKMLENCIWRSSKRRNFRQDIWWSMLYGRKDGLWYGSTVVHMPWLIDWPAGLGLGKK